MSVSELRVFECDGCDAKAMAEVQSGMAEWIASRTGPEIELIARAAAVKALEEISGDVHGEATVLLGAR